MEQVAEKANINFNSVGKNGDSGFLIEGEYWSDLGEDVIISLVIDKLNKEEIISNCNRDLPMYSIPISFEEIDNVCEDLREYKLNLSKLPFRTNGLINEDVQIKATPSDKEFILPVDNSRYEDEVDDQLRSLAGL